MDTARSIVIGIGIVSICIGVLPWIGLGGYWFGVPGLDIELPRIHLLHSKVLYDMASIPLKWIALIRPFDELVYFGGGGLRAVRPFMVSMFWLLCGMTEVWLALRWGRYQTDY